MHRSFIARAHIAQQLMHVEFAPRENLLLIAREANRQAQLSRTVEQQRAHRDGAKKQSEEDPSVRSSG